MTGTTCRLVALNFSLLTHTCKSKELASINHLKARLVLVLPLTNVSLEDLKDFMLPLQTCKALFKSSLLLSVLTLALWLSRLTHLESLPLTAPLDVELPQIMLLWPLDTTLKLLKAITSFVTLGALAGVTKAMSTLALRTPSVSVVSTSVLDTPSPRPGPLDC